MDDEKLLKESSDEMGPLASTNVADSATEMQMLEQSQPVPLVENPDFPLTTLGSGIETQGFASSLPGGEFSSSQLPLSYHLPEQSGSTNINVQQLVSDFETHEKKEGSLPAFSNLMPGSNIDYSIHSDPTLTSTNLGVLQTPASGNAPEILDPNVQTQEKYGDLLLQGRESRPFLSGSTISIERTEVGMDLDPSYIDVYEGQQSTSRHETITVHVPSGSQFKSASDVTAAEETLIRSKSSSRKISKYALNAQKLLFTVLEEMMKFSEDHNQYNAFTKLFRGLHLSPVEREMVLTLELLLYLDRRKTASCVRNLFKPHVVTTECIAQLLYEDLFCNVVSSLIVTVSERSSFNFKEIIKNYKSLKCLYNRCLEFGTHDKDVQDEDSRIRVECLKRMIQRLVLQTRNASREFLIHIGEHADKDIINSLEEELLEEDKSYLRTQFS